MRNLFTFIGFVLALGYLVSTSASAYGEKLETPLFTEKIALGSLLSELEF